MKIDERVEKDRRKLENRLEVDYANLQEQNRGLQELVRQNGWTIHGLLTRMEAMEARMALLSAQVSVVAPPQQVDLTREENEGGVGGPIELGSPFLGRSPSPQQFTREELDTVEAVGRNWEFLTRDVPTEGEYTPTGPRRIWDSPEASIDVTE